MSSAETHGSPERTVLPSGWTRVGVAGVAALVTILSGCAGTSSSGATGSMTSANASQSSGESSQAQAKPSDSAETRPSNRDSSAGPSASASEPPSGQDGKSSEPATGKGGREGGASPTEKPTPESRPKADLPDEKIRDIYSDDTGPGRPVTATLCNLTQGHLEQLEKHITGPDGLDDSNLRLALISLGDLLGVWEGLTWHLPEAAADIDTAREIYASWDFALALQESGDSAAVEKELVAASEAIDRLPADPEVEVGCGG